MRKLQNFEKQLKHLNYKTKTFVFYQSFVGFEGDLLYKLLHML